jgi:uncharacterized protein YdeI (YjbR/CyaY-like superfamily)
MGRRDDRERVLVETRAQWRAWLRRHHETSVGIWLVRWKKATGRPQVSYEAVVEEALCFGWVDSRPSSLDEQRSALLLTPRRPRSSWSRINKQRIQALEAANQLAPAGRAAVERAKADGSWTALDQVETLVEPADLRAALDTDPPARAHWDGFPRSTRRAILEWIASARTDATRDRRVRQTVADASKGIRANQWRQPKRS